jgi:hypothetical protein
MNQKGNAGLNRLFAAHLRSQRHRGRSIASFRSLSEIAKLRKLGINEINRLSRFRSDLSPPMIFVPAWQAKTLVSNDMGMSMGARWQSASTNSSSSGGENQ